MTAPPVLLPSFALKHVSSAFTVFAAISSILVLMHMVVTMGLPTTASSRTFDGIE